MLFAEAPLGATEQNRITDKIIGAAISVHKTLGPGLLESAYLACLTFELATEGLSVECEKALPVPYKGVNLDCGYRLDLLVEHLVIVEVKAVDRLAPMAQMLSYLRLCDLRVGLLINFNVQVLKAGLRRIINGYIEDCPL